MGRLVKPARAAPPPASPRGVVEGGLEGVGGVETPAADPPPAQGGDGYLERVAKYIPSEVVGFFLFVNNILMGANTPPEAKAAAAGGSATDAVGGATMAGFQVSTIGIWVFILAWIFTPLYLHRMREPGDAWKLNAIIGAALFPIWAYAVQGVGVTHFVEFSGDLASIVLGVATVASGLFQPKARDAAAGAETK